MSEINPRQWGRTPTSLSGESRFEAIHFRVYIAMASSVARGTRISRIGQRLIATRLDVSHVTVGKLQQDLVAWGHIRPVECIRGQRRHYEMTSVAFDATPKNAATKKPQKTVRSGVRGQASAWARIQEGRERA